MGSPGVYQCRVVRAMRSVSSKKQTPCIAVQAEVEFLEGLEAVWGNIYLTEATIGTPHRPGMAVQQLRDLGYAGALGEAYRNPSVLVGGAGKCVVEESQGGVRISRFGVPHDAEIVAAELARLEAFDMAGAAQPSTPTKGKPPAGYFGEDPSVENFDKMVAEDRAASRGLAANPNPGPIASDAAGDEDIPF